MILTVIATVEMDRVRGYTAVGGEALILPGLLALHYIIRQMLTEWDRLKRKPNTKTETEVKRDGNRITGSEKLFGDTGDTGAVELNAGRKSTTVHSEHYQHGGRKQGIAEM